ncbi:MAG: peroxiredoxin [Bryobacterales bacterium]|nr:peroxiredoxin [Bryobacterales bacterium]
MLSWLISDPLEVGSHAPEFSLPDERGATVSLRELRGRNVVLVWYPGDDTTVCRKQLCELRDEWAELTRRGVAVFGINPQSAESHAKFRAKFGFPFPLLVDSGQRVGKLYRTHGIVAKRTVYVIGPDGRVRYAKRGKPAVSDVLELLD